MRSRVCRTPCSCDTWFLREGGFFACVLRTRKQELCVTELLAGLEESIRFVVSRSLIFSDYRNLFALSLSARNKRCSGKHLFSCRFHPLTHPPFPCFSLSFFCSCYPKRACTIVQALFFCLLLANCLSLPLFITKPPSLAQNKGGRFLSKPPKRREKEKKRKITVRDDRLPVPCQRRTTPLFPGRSERQ